MACIRQCAAVGYDAVEMNLETLPLIIHGKTCDRVADWLKGALGEFPIAKTAHIGTGVELRSENFELHKRVLMSSVDVCARLGFELLNVHYEERGRDLRAEKRFLEGHREAAQRAQDLGVKLSIENIEVEQSARVVEFVEEVDHPNLFMTIDTGHLYLSSRYFGYDMRETLRRCAPKLAHIHLNDNVGVFCPLRLEDFDRYKMVGLRKRTTFGEGDIHLPPGYGTLPFSDVLAHFPDFSGIAVCEYEVSRFEPFIQEIHDYARKLIST